MNADGKSKATFLWSSSLDASRVAASLTAGTVLSVRDGKQGRVAVEVRAPNLSESQTGTLEISDAAGRVRARRQIRFHREPPPLTSQTSSGPYSLSAPESMVLGVHGEARVTFRAAEADGVQLYANVGTIEGLRAAGDGTYEATYVPPRKKYPQVAIVAAIGLDRQRLDWLAIPLHGRPEVTTRSEPLSVVFVDVEKRRYGPLRTDRRGEARLRVWVPPGVPRATTVARDSLGNQRSAPLDLRVPAFSRQLLMCSEATPLLTVVAVGQSGKPLSRPDFTVDTSLGSVSGIQRRAPGVFDLGLQLPPDAVTGRPVRVSTVPRRGPSRGSICHTRVAGETPRTVRLEIGSSRYVAGGDDVEIRVELAYAGRREAGEARLIFKPSSGAVHDLERVSSTTFRARYKPDDAFEGKTTARLSVQVEGTDLVGDVEVPLVPGAPASMTVELSQASLAADGASSATLRAIVRDVGGNATDGKTPTARATGTISAFERKGVGEYAATYTAPASSRGGGDRIVLEAGAARATQWVDLTALDRPFIASARVGYFTNFGRISAVTVAAAGSMRLPFAERLAVGLSLAYYQQESDVADDETGSSVKVDIASTPLVVQAIYEIPIGMVVPYAGAGAGLVVNWTELRGDIVSSESVVVRPTVVVMGGLTFPLHSGTTLLGGLMAQAQYGYAKVDNGTVTGNLGGLDVTAGYQYEF